MTPSERAGIILLAFVRRLSDLYSLIKAGEIAAYNSIDALREETQKAINSDMGKEFFERVISGDPRSFKQNL